MTTAYEKLLETESGREALCVEHAITNVTELIAQLLEKSGMTRTELAEKLDVVPGRITQILTGEANMELATIAKVLGAFDQVLEVSSRSIHEQHVAPVWCQHQPWSPAPLQYTPKQPVARLGSIGRISTRLAG